LVIFPSVSLSWGIDPKDILIDVNYVANKNNYRSGELKFYNEYEIVTRPMKGKAKIVMVYEP